MRQNAIDGAKFVHPHISFTFCTETTQVHCVTYHGKRQTVVYSRSPSYDIVAQNATDLTKTAVYSSEVREKICMLFIGIHCCLSLVFFVTVAYIVVEVL